MVLTPSHIKDTIVQGLGSLTPEDIFSNYSEAIEPWFPIISVDKLRSRLPPLWGDAPLDLILLCLSIVLLTKSPPPPPQNNEESPEFRSFYLCIKSWISFTEGLGMNSLEIVQARILVTLFEVAHGFYPAAYISLGATVRAADALGVHLVIDISPLHHSNEEAKRIETVLTWCGIRILDRQVSLSSSYNGHS